MSTKNKTTETNKNVVDFLQEYANSEQKINDSLNLIALMKKATGCDPKIWGSSIIGFGSYFYKYDSGHEGVAPLIGFSPRKTAISLYVYTGHKEHEYLLKDLGKFKMGKACIYIKKLEDINTTKLKALMSETIHYLNVKYMVKNKL